MNISITQNHNVEGNRSWDCLESDYSEYLEKFGLVLIPISTHTKPRQYFKKMNIDGIILSGGNDLHPKTYHQTEKLNKNSYIKRDEMEIELIKIAIERDIPVFGICRGMQLINAYFGGSLCQDLKTEYGLKHSSGEIHSVAIVDRRLAEHIGKESVLVNSYHHQGVMNVDISKFLKPFAISNDGVIEGLYHPKYRIAGIQWHPERKNSDDVINTKIIEAFKEKTLFWKKPL